MTGFEPGSSGVKSNHHTADCATTAALVVQNCFFLIRPFPASFSLFSSFQYTVDSIQMFNINKFLPMTGFEPRTSGIGSDRSTNWATQPLP